MFFKIAEKPIFWYKKRQYVRIKKPDFQKNLFKTRLKDLINTEQPLVKLADKVSWDKMEIEFRNLYSIQRSPSIPIIKIAGLLLLKKRFNESEESVLDFSLNDF
jgi:IS5 family transposase